MSEPQYINIVLPKVIKDVIDERSRQIVKWGMQSHEDGAGNEVFKQFEEGARALNKYAVEHNQLTWANILEEEFWEALATTDKKRLREELVQVAAVAVAWIEDLDTR